MCRPVLGLVAYGVTETDWPRVTRPQHPQGSITVVHHKGDEAMARRLRAQATTDGDSRRAELRATVQLALPLVATQLGQIAIHTTDVVMIGWLGPQSLAAGIRGHQVYFVSWLFGLGILTVIAPLVAQAMGAKCCAPQLLTGLVTAGLQPAIRLSRLENPMLNGEIEY